MIHVAINGFGRIGRTLTRLLSAVDDIKIVAINDIASNEMMVHLLQYDSVHGTFDKSVSLEDAHTMRIEHDTIALLSHTQHSTLDFAFHGADVVFECTGKFLTQKDAQHHIDKGIKKVIFSAPAADEDTPTFVMGVNHTLYEGQAVLSNASCTTNCLAPIAKILDDAYGIDKGLMTTVHAYTNGQSIVDTLEHKDKRRSRAAGVNLIPTTTHAAWAINRVLPNLKGKLHGQSVRVPTPNVSIMDLNVSLLKNTTIDELNHLFKTHAQGDMQGILYIDEAYRVSQDFLGCHHSAVVAQDLTQVIGDNMIKVMAWYDNEWGYASRLVDMVRHVMHPQFN